MNVAVCVNTPGWPKQANASLAALFEQLTNNRLANVSLVNGGDDRDASLLLVDCGQDCRVPRSPSSGNKTVPSSNTFVLLAGDQLHSTKNEPSYHALGASMVTIPTTIVDENDNLLTQPKVINSVEELVELVQRQKQKQKQKIEIDEAKQAKMTKVRLIANGDENDNRAKRQL